MTLFFPGAITMAAEARVSAKRIEVINLSNKLLSLIFINIKNFKFVEFSNAGRD